MMNCTSSFRFGFRAACACDSKAESGFDYVRLDINHSLSMVHYVIIVIGYTINAIYYAEIVVVHAFNDTGNTFYDMNYTISEMNYARSDTNYAFLDIDYTLLVINHTGALWELINPPVAGVKGEVKVSGTNVPIVGAIVTTQKEGEVAFEMLTDDEGSYSHQVSAGKYKIVVSAEGYVS